MLRDLAARDDFSSDDFSSDDDDEDAMQKKVIYSSSSSSATTTTTTNNNNNVHVKPEPSKGKQKRKHYETTNDIQLKVLKKEIELQRKKEEIYEIQKRKLLIEEEVATLKKRKLEREMGGASEVPKVIEIDETLMQCLYENTLNLQNVQNVCP